MLEEPAPTRRADDEGFVGEVLIDELAAADTGLGMNALRVHFSPSAHTQWHRHRHGQVLIITAGVGLVQERGGDIVTVRAGDTVTCAPDVWHWHGAAPDRSMSHIAVQGVGPDGTVVEWDLVAPDDYPQEGQRQGQ